MAMHAGWKRSGCSNNAVLAVECDGPIAAGRVRRSLDRFLDLCPWPAARLRRRLPWGTLHWAAGPRAALAPPPVRHETVATDGALHRLVEAEVNRAIDPRREPPLRVVTVERGGDTAGARGALIMTWFHPLMDPRGAQTLLTHLAALDGDERAVAEQTPPEFSPAPDPRPLQERGRVARKSLAYMRTLAPIAPVSPGAALSHPGPVRFRRFGFVDGDAAATRPRTAREMPWRLALLGKAMAALWRRHNLPDVPFMVPISVDLRPKGEPGPMFGNLLAFHFARFPASATEDVPALARALRRQMADAVRDGQIEANAVAMEFLRYRPLSMMMRALPWSSGGDAFSFNCADLGDFPVRAETVFGRRVLNAFHVPAVLPRPGIGVFFNRCGGRDNVVVAWVEGAAGEDDAIRIGDVVREGMGWTRTA